MAKIPETREVMLWEGSKARELAINYHEITPLFTLAQPYKDSLELELREVLSKI